MTATADPTYDTLNYDAQGGAQTVIGGTLDVVSGGVLNIDAGAALKIAGVTVSPSDTIAGDLNVESGGYIDIKTGGALKIAGVAITPSASELNELADAENVLTYYGRISVADINAGKVLIAAVSGRTLRLINFKLRAVGSNAAGSDAITLADTAGTPVLCATVPIADLTNGALVNDASANVVIGAGYLVGCTASKGIGITKTGATLTGASSGVDVVLTYSIV